MNNIKYIEGFYERLNEACRRYGKTKVEIAKECGFDRKNLSAPYNNRMLSSGNLARFCALTGTDANWLLGVTNARRDIESEDEE